MPVLSALGAIGSAVGGIGGAIGGAAGNKTQQNKLLGPASALETQAEGLSTDQLSQLQGLTGSGPGQQDVTAGLGAQRDLAAQFQALSQSGGLPTQSDINTSQGLSQSLFGGRQEALNQQFGEEQTRTAQLAAQLGRPINDPILQAKLAQSKFREQSLLEADKNAFSTQFALQQPERRIGFQQQGANILSGLSAQAFNNRAVLFGLGQGALSQQQNFRGQNANQTTTQGGGFGGAFTGAIQGISSGQQTFSDIGSMFQRKNPFEGLSGRDFSTAQADAAGRPSRGGQ